MKTLALVGTHGGGDSALVAYNLAWMCAHSGFKVLCVDLTTAARLSTMFFSWHELTNLWLIDAERRANLVNALARPVVSDGADVDVRIHLDHSRMTLAADVLSGHAHEHAAAFRDDRERLAVILGDPALAGFAERFERAWCGTAPADPAAWEVLTRFRRVINAPGARPGADFVIVDLGAEPGALMRAGLLAAGASVTVTAQTPTSARAFETLSRLRRDWEARVRELAGGEPASDLAAMSGSVHIESLSDFFFVPPDCLGRVRFARSLGALSLEARKPMFLLTPSDGAMGGHAAAVFDARRDWQALARAIADRAGLEWPATSD